MYTIFKDDTSIILTDSLKNINKKDFYYWKDINLHNLFLQIKKGEISKFILYYPDLELMWNEFLKYFKVIEAAGGLVQNSEKEILFIYRNDKWDLPKGKIENGEGVEEAAIREVQEECGISKVVIKNFIAKSYHIYNEKESEILKVTHWFSMFSDEIKSSPQVEEGITKVQWKNKEQINIALQNTYSNIKLLVENFN